MSTIRLGPPPAFVSAAALETVRVAPEKLCRLSLFEQDEPYFHHSGNNRFDAPVSGSGPQFSTCYFGLGFAVAFAETVLRDRVAELGEFKLARQTLENFKALQFEGVDLTLADLTGAALKRLTGNADLAGSDIYDITQQWSLAVFNNPAKFDGIIYMSRHLNTDKAVVVYDRASHKIHLRSVSTLFAASGYDEAVQMFEIRVR